MVHHADTMLAIYMLQPNGVCRISKPFVLLCCVNFCCSTCFYIYVMLVHVHAWKAHLALKSGSQ